VLFPASHDDVVGIVRLANRQRLALVARGAGSGNVGGAMPTGSLVVSFECMNAHRRIRPGESADGGRARRGHRRHRCAGARRSA
jgi:D-lactate dehydrogenase (quinone)